MTQRLRYSLACLTILALGPIACADSPAIRGLDGRAYTVHTGSTPTLIEQRPVADGKTVNVTVLDMAKTGGNQPAGDAAPNTALTVGRSGRIYVTESWQGGQVIGFYDPRTGETGTVDSLAEPTVDTSSLKAPSADAAHSPAARYLDTAIGWCDQTEHNLPEITRVAEIIAERHIAGGLLIMDWSDQTLGPELSGRSGGFVHTGTDRPWKKDRTDIEKANDVAILGWDRGLRPYNVERVQKLKDRGVFVVGFGPKNGKEISAVAAVCDVFFDTGYGEPDLALDLGNGVHAGRANHVVNAIHGWALGAEIVGALTRRGKMPTMWMSYSKPGGKEWGSKYLGKVQFHDEFDVPAQPAGKLAKEYLDRMRYFITRLKMQELGNLRKASDLAWDEVQTGNKVELAWAGHSGHAYLGKYEGSWWSKAFEYHAFLESQRDHFAKNGREGALVIRVGYHGFDPLGKEQMKQLKKRLIFMGGAHDDPDWQPPTDDLLNIDLGWAYGDACVKVDGYPNPLFPPSGVVQAVAVESIDVELAAKRAAAGDAASTDAP